MINVLTIVLLYDNHKWLEVNLTISTRDITMEQIYEKLPNQLKSKKLYKIIKLGHNRLYQINILNLSENKIDA